MQWRSIIHHKTHRKNFKYPLLSERNQYEIVYILYDSYYIWQSEKVKTTETVQQNMNDNQTLGRNKDGGYFRATNCSVEH